MKEKTLLKTKKKHLKTLCFQVSIIFTGVI